VATQFPDYVTRLALAGAPIDTSLGESSLKKAQEVPFWKYQMIVAMNGGIMPGWLMNLSWKSANPKMHYWDRIVAPTDQTDRFYAWYDDVQNLAGGWYLEIMKELFLENTFKDTLDIQCPVHVMTGMRDEITPPEQTLAILEHVRSGVICSRECDAGHLGVFTAKKAMPMWTEYFQSC
jgi:poly(3-hydroxyalkanoate) synthetase